MAAKKLKLTWQKGLNLWCKVYRGKKYYLGKGKSKSDMDSYRLALEEWEKKRLVLTAEKPNGQDYKRAIELRERMVKFAELEGLTDQPFSSSVKKIPVARYGRLPYASVSCTENEDIPVQRGDKEVQIQIDGLLPKWHNKLTKEVKWLRQNLERVNPPKLEQHQIDPLDGADAMEKRYWASRIDALTVHERWAGITDPAKSIGANVMSIFRQW